MAKSNTLGMQSSVSPGVSMACLWCVTLDKPICHSKPYFPFLYNGEDNSPPSERTQQGKLHGTLAYSRSSINYYVGVLKFIWECDGI